MDKLKSRRHVHKRSNSESEWKADPRRKFHQRSYSCPGVHVNGVKYNLINNASPVVRESADGYDVQDTIKSHDVNYEPLGNNHVNLSVGTGNFSTHCEDRTDDRQGSYTTEQRFAREEIEPVKRIQTGILLFYFTIINVILFYLLVISLLIFSNEMHSSKDDQVYNNSTTFEKCNTNHTLFEEISQTFILCKKRFLSKKLKFHLNFFYLGSNSVKLKKSKFIVFPINSLNNLFTSLENGSSYENSMNFEWMRIRSFSSFRDTQNTSPIALSRMGFFYTGTGSDVQCFSCGAVYNRWSSDDDLYQLHRRMSPNCLHLTGNDPRNVPVGHRNASTSSQGSDNTASSSFSCNERSVRSSHMSATSANNIAQNNIAFATTPDNESRIRLEGRPSMEHFRSRNSVSTAPPIANNARTNPLDQASGISRATINKLSPLGVIFDKPRYPQYAVLTVRMSTYNGWPATQIPRKMAEAGFIYAGYADYARCFFCGGGLRNWEEGDDPWIEHARWFPRCAYVRQNKGEQFVQLVHERLEEMVKSADNENTASPQRIEESEAQLSCQQSSATNNSEYQSANLQSLPSYQSVRELGYSSDVIENSIHILKQQGKKEFPAADILNVIFEMEAKDDSCNEKSSHATQEAASLLKENRRLTEQRLCMICVEKNSCITFLPCGHLVCCEECAPAMRKCPRCQQIVQGSIKTWLV